MCSWFFTVMGWRRAMTEQERTFSLQRVNFSLRKIITTNQPMPHMRSFYFLMPVLTCGNSVSVLTSQSVQRCRMSSCLVLDMFRKLGTVEQDNFPFRPIKDFHLLQMMKKAFFNCGTHSSRIWHHMVWCIYQYNMTV